MSLHRTVNGIVYEVTSPSFWELAGYPVQITYVGDEWQLYCPGENLQPLVRSFPRLKDAQGMIETAILGLRDAAPR